MFPTNASAYSQGHFAENGNGSGKLFVPHFHRSFGGWVWKASAFQRGAWAVLAAGAGSLAAGARSWEGSEPAPLPEGAGGCPPRSWTLPPAPMLSGARDALVQAETPRGCPGGAPHGPEQRCSDLNPPALLPFLASHPSAGFASLPPRPVAPSSPSQGPCKPRPRRGVIEAARRAYGRAGIPAGAPAVNWVLGGSRRPGGSRLPVWLPPLCPSRSSNATS